MKKNLLSTLAFLFIFCVTNMQAQNVPNGGFENWTAGEPDNWFTSNTLGAGTNVTQETPPYAGTYALRGAVINSIAGPVPTFIASTDMLGNGFAVSQAYSTLSFAYKMSVTGTSSFLVGVLMMDALDSTVGAGGAVYSGTVNTYTQVSIPIVYTGSNPVSCVILFEIVDTTSAPLVVGNYFVVDAVGLSGNASVQELPTSINIANVYPNPASLAATVHYNLVSKSDVQFRVLNTQGKMMREILLPETAEGNHEMTLDVAALPEGLYIITMKTDKGTSFTRLQVVR